MIDHSVITELAAKSGLGTTVILPMFAGQVCDELVSFANLVAERAVQDHVAKHSACDSWAANPDRSGGQFTQDEIMHHGEWR
jgi:hypothetical protein